MRREFRTLRSRIRTFLMYLAWNTVVRAPSVMRNPSIGT